MSQVAVANWPQQRVVSHHLTILVLTIETLNVSGKLQWLMAAECICTLLISTWRHTQHVHMIMLRFNFVLLTQKLTCRHFGIVKWAFFYCQYSVWLFILSGVNLGKCIFRTGLQNEARWFSIKILILYAGLTNLSKWSFYFQEVLNTAISLSDRYVTPDLTVHGSPNSAATSPLMTSNRYQIRCGSNSAATGGGVVEVFTPLITQVNFIACLLLHWLQHAQFSSVTFITHSNTNFHSTQNSGIVFQWRDVV